MALQNAYTILYSSALTLLGLLTGLMLARAIIGPSITDRILCINMTGTLVIASIAILSRLLGEGYLVDVALIYTMISFISVLMLARIYIPANGLRARTGREAYAEYAAAEAANRKGSDAHGR